MQSSRIYHHMHSLGNLHIDRRNRKRHRPCLAHLSAAGVTKVGPDYAHKSFSDLTPEVYIRRNFHGYQQVRETAGCPLKTSGVRRGILENDYGRTRVHSQCAYSGKPLGGVGGSSSSGDSTLRSNAIPKDVGGRTRVPHFFLPFPSCARLVHLAARVSATVNRHEFNCSSTSH